MKLLTLWKPITSRAFGKIEGSFCSLEITELRYKSVTSHCERWSHAVHYGAFTVSLKIVNNAFKVVVVQLEWFFSLFFDVSYSQLDIFLLHKILVWINCLSLSNSVKIYFYIAFKLFSRITDSKHHILTDAHYPMPIFTVRICIDLGDRKCDCE